MRLIKNKKQKGFTLIEMMVSIALFTVVMTAALGSILTISDSNKKARSLMSVMTNLNFAVDSMVRSFKTGEIVPNSPFVTSVSGKECFHTNEIDYRDAGEGFEARKVEYCFVPGTGDMFGKITKEIIDSGSSPVDLTPPDVDIQYVTFVGSDYNSQKQPMLTITVSGEVRVSPRITSDFSIQTSVSQRKLNI